MRSKGCSYSSFEDVRKIRDVRYIINDRSKRTRSLIVSQTGQAPRMFEEVPTLLRRGDTEGTLFSLDERLRANTRSPLLYHHHHRP